MTTVWPASTFPVALDTFAPALLDGLDDCLASHQNVPALALVEVQTKLGIDGDPISGLGGVGFQAAGKAANPNAATPLIPTIWVDNAAFTLKYSYNSIDYDIFTSGSASLQAGLWTEFGSTDNITADDNADTFDPTADGMCIWHVLVYNSTTPSIAEYTISAVWDYTAGTVEFRSAKTLDIGDTSGIVLSVTATASTSVELAVDWTSGTWTVKGARYYTTV